MIKRLKNIKTNVITGFLGVGKTSAVLNLVEQKPQEERWSVLVNEFGQIGIDGAIYKAKGITVKEIPGGCMCCSAGVPLEVAVNQVLKATRPHRLLIEPSGLGHPKRVLDTLRGEYFKDVLNIGATICLLDPHHLQDARYTTHENFIDQIALADILVANKIDICDSNTLQIFDDYVSSLRPQKQNIIKTQFGRLDASMLNQPANLGRKASYPEHHSLGASITNDGYSSTGVVFPKDNIFDFNSLQDLFKALAEEQGLRIKAILHTTQGWMIFNIAQQQSKLTRIESADDNRVEVIGRTSDNTFISITKEQLEKRIKACEKVI